MSIPSTEHRGSFDEARNTFEEIQPIHALSDDEPVTHLLATFLRLLDDIDMDIGELFEGRFIETATQEELDKLGNNVGVERKTGEKDEKFRKRVQAGYRAATSRGTYEDIGEVARLVLDTDPQAISLFPARETADPATAVVEAHSSIIDDSPFTESEIENLLSRSAVGGHRILLQRSDVFTWGDPDNGWGSDWGKHVE